MRALSPGGGAHVVADENDYAAAFRGSVQQIFGGDEDAVVDVGGAADVEVADLLGNLGLVGSERDLQFGLSGKREQRDFIFRLES